MNPNSGKKKQTFIPTIDNPPEEVGDRPPGKKRNSKGGKNSNMLIDLETSSMSEKQKENQQKGALRAMDSVSKLEQDMPKILALLEDKENAGAITTLQKHTLLAVVQMLGTALDRYRTAPFSDNAYAVAAVVTQIRSLVGDLQASRDRSLISDRINKVVIKGAFVMMIQVASEYNSVLKSALSDKVKPEYSKSVSLEIDNNLRQLAKYMGETYDSIAEQITALLIE